MNERSAKYVQLCSPYHAVAGHSQRGPAVYLPLPSPLLTRPHLAINIPVIIQLHVEYQVPPSHSTRKTAFEGIMLKLNNCDRGSRDKMASESPKHL